jgi:hypothetical protein
MEIRELKAKLNPELTDRTKRDVTFNNESLCLFCHNKHCRHAGYGNGDQGQNFALIFNTQCGIYLPSFKLKTPNNG